MRQLGDRRQRCVDGRRRRRRRLELRPTERVRHPQLRHVEVQDGRFAARYRRCDPIDIGNLSMSEQARHAQRHAAGEQLREHVVELLDAGTAATIAGHGHDLLMPAQRIRDERSQIAAGPDLDEHAHAIGIQALRGFGEAHLGFPLLRRERAYARRVFGKGSGAAGAVQRHASGTELDVLVIVAVGVGHRTEQLGVIGTTERQFLTDCTFGGQLGTQFADRRRVPEQNQLVRAVVHRRDDAARRRAQ